MKFGLSFRLSLLISLLIIVLCSSIISLFLFEYNFSLDEIRRSDVVAARDALTDQARKKSEALARLVAGSLVNQLYYHEMDVMFDLVRATRSQDGVDYIYVFEPSGEVIHDGTVSFEAFGLRLDDSRTGESMTSGKVLSWTENGVYHATAPVMMGPKVLGGIRVGLKLDEITADIESMHATLSRISEEGRTRFIRTTALAALVLAVAGIVLGLLSARGLIRPITALATATREIGRGRYEIDVPIGRSDEIGDLARSVEQMAKDLERSENDLRNALDEAVHQANHDSLTGLPNRLLAHDRLSQAIVRAHRDASMVAVMFIDLDDFKKVNDTSGHAIGDTMLKEVANRLGGCLRTGDTVARFGGDEIIAILPDLDETVQIDAIAEKILAACRNPFPVGGSDMFISASIGITLYPSDDTTPQLLMRNADTAMYEAKRKGRGTFNFFTSDLNRRAIERVRMESGLRRALRKGQLSLHYQPLVDVASGRIVGAEALLRWYSPILGEVPPLRFIPVAEETGLIGPITEWVLATACRDAMTWRQASEAPHFVTVNISNRQFRYRGFVDLVSHELQSSGLPPDSLELEITESVLPDDSETPEITINRLREIGVRFSMDDFGTGFSSVSSLMRLPFDTLKIDRSFIRHVAADADDANMVASVIAMARTLRLRTVAEGVEEVEQLEFIKSAGGVLAQGWFFSKAVTSDELVELITGPSGKTN